jgi:Lipid A 3-O-deacylase (PagL)
VNSGGHWFIRHDLALTVALHCLHLSSAGLHDPNPGLNEITGTLSATFFF